MSISPAVASKPGQLAPAPIAAFAARSWDQPTEAAEQPGFELSGVVMHFAADRPIYVEGDEARCFYKMVSGVVRTCRFLTDGRRQIGAFHSAGEVFGLEANAYHGMSAEAVSDCTVVAYRRRGLEAMIGQDQRLGRWFFSHVMNCLAATREHSLLLGRGSAVQKISAFLLEAADHEGSDDAIDLAMSRQDIADYLGLTIETVSRTLSQLERDGTIRLPTARRVVLQDRRTLGALNS